MLFKQKQCSNTQWVYHIHKPVIKQKDILFNADKKHCIHFNINLLPRLQFRKDNVQVHWHGQIVSELLNLTLFTLGHPDEAAQHALHVVEQLMWVCHA